jgi:hypothetical protein
MYILPIISKDSVMSYDVHTAPLMVLDNQACRLIGLLSRL